VTAPTQSWRRSRGRRTGAAAALAVVVALVLGACAQTPGTAAVVDGRVVTETRFERAHRELDRIVANPVDPMVVLQSLIYGPFYLDAAERYGAGVSDNEAREFARQIAEQSGEDASRLGEGALEVLRFSLATDKLQQVPDGDQAFAEVDQRIREADIRINPRYGQRDAETGQIQVVRPEWITQARG
jgi:hypothetical protein